MSSTQYALRYTLYEFRLTDIFGFISTAEPFFRIISVRRRISDDRKQATDDRKQATDIGPQTSDLRLQISGNTMSSISQNAIKSGFFVISGKNQRRISFLRSNPRCFASSTWQNGEKWRVSFTINYAKQSQFISYWVLCKSALGRPTAESQGPRAAYSVYEFEKAKPIAGL